MRPRADLLKRLQALKSIDVLIIGGGINGVGIMRDLAAQGVASLLAEQGDFGGGTSAAPSRLIHGGLRYLETGEFALVRESVEERNLLLHNAAHVVKPIRVWVPVKGWFGGLGSAVGRALRLIRTPSSKGGCVVAMGLWVYDWFGRAYRSMPGHRMVSRREALATVPSMTPTVSVIGEYYDARISHPERLVAELVADAEADCPGAMAVNYLAATGRRGGNVELTDRLSGEKFTVTPRIVINAAGPWVDAVDDRLGYSEKLMGGTKGSHLVIRAPELVRELGDTMLYFETPDHRICLIYRMEGDLFLLGTTDLRTDDPADVVCSQAEIDYLFRVLRDVLPQSRLGPSSVVFHYAGVRPLPASRAGATGAISRDHKLHVREPDSGRPFPLLTLVGGKWTTYRACAEQVADAALARLGTGRRTSTKHLAIGGGRGLDVTPGSVNALTASIVSATGLPEEVVARLVGRYGSGAGAIAAAVAVGPDRAVAGAPTYSSAEIVWLACNERVERLEDIVLRRTLIAFEGLAVPEVLADLADILAVTLGWNRARRDAEVAATVELMARRHGVPAALAAAA